MLQGYTRRPSTRHRNYSDLMCVPSPRIKYGTNSEPAEGPCMVRQGSPSLVITSTIDSF